MLKITDGLRDLIAETDVILSDIWGVVHNGVAASHEACDALGRFRKGGGTVVLVTNAPRPADSVERQLGRLHVPTDTYDAIVSSGDVTRGYIENHRGKTLFHIGPERDHSLFRGLEVAYAPFEAADYIVCTSPFNDETETPEDYRTMLTQAAARKMVMLCANPDIVVERGDKLIYCAGALAEMYATMNGEVIYGGKPHPPIYERAMMLARQARGAETAKARVLAIGDSVRTDLEGANAFGLRCLFVTGGIHAGELGERDAPDINSAAELFRSATRPPLAVTVKLRW